MEKIYLFGAGEDGVKLFNSISKKIVNCFIDNDSSKWGSYINNIEIKSPKTLECNSDKVIITTNIYFEQIEQQLIDMGIDRSRILTVSEFLETAELNINERILELKEKYKNKRCFILGTGPSLTIEDLEILKKNNEITFASNKIFKLFDKTDWRPDIYCVSDMEVLNYYYNQICDLDIKQSFIINLENSKYSSTLDLTKIEANNKYVFNALKREMYDCEINASLPSFSTEAHKYVVDGGITVTYAMLQFAYFLGFSEVYLLGVDFSYSDKSGKDESKKDHFCDNYIEKDEPVNYPKIEQSLNAYKSAEKFSKNKDFKIFNATRGGKLEVFKRVDFDKLMEV